MSGKVLLNQVTDATGLPGNMIERELSNLAEKHGVSVDNMTLDDLRVIMADYLQEVILQAKETYS
jgi:hypothetical protein